MGADLGDASHDQDYPNQYTHAQHLLARWEAYEKCEQFLTISCIYNMDILTKKRYLVDPQ
jgi:hypothetical protein